jgi:hypothetical protein
VGYFFYFARKLGFSFLHVDEEEDHLIVHK